jgi:hypothetical protein
MQHLDEALPGGLRMIYILRNAAVLRFEGIKDCARDSLASSMAFNSQAVRP